MGVRTGFLALTISLLPLPAAAQAPAPPPVSAEEQRQLDWAVERGRLLFALDRAAWVATDDMRERIPDPAMAGLAGYIVDRDAEGFTAIFYGREDGRHVTIYRARIAGNGVTEPVVFAPGQRPALSPAQVRLARASEAVRAGPIGRCSEASPNVAIVPPAGPQDPIDVYITAPQMRSDRVQFGGHFRISYDASGREIARRPFTRTCLEVPIPPANVRSQGGMLGVSHLLDSRPNEVHVFIAMSRQQPLVVMTPEPNRVWEVTGEAIRLLQIGHLKR
jgi:hypothetical protein